VAEATRQGEITRGQGDGEKNRIFAEAFGQDPDFFGFYRSMNAYQSSLKGDNTTVILSPDSEFFRYFSGGAAAGGRR
jgi:membrane protease subunit HflC